MQITNSTINDIDKIFSLYRIATEYQKTKHSVLWPEFERTLVEEEIKEKRQWKIVVDNTISCVFATTFSDPLIWEERDQQPSIYIHRIATNPAYRGKNFVTHIVDWAKLYAKENNKEFIRLDTVGENKGLIKHYQSCGFDFLGVFKLANTEGLPQHYHNASVSLFEIFLPAKNEN
jgi:ribosomal protein S18 acetylase RimI-like enzyme